MEIRKNTKNLGSLIIKPIEKSLAKSLCITNHYSHKWNEQFGKYNFGIFKENNPDNCLGVSVYGYMKNPKAQIFECKSTLDGWLIELNRMWISDELGKNAETLLIGASIKLLKQLDPTVVAVQSFADGRLGCGTIYKASNFDYYGFHWTRFLRNKKTGEVVHEQLLTNTTSTRGYLRHNILFVIGDYEVFKVKTYRYIYPLKKDFVFTLKEKQTYPEYEKGEHPCDWSRDMLKIKQNITMLMDRLAA